MISEELDCNEYEGPSVFDEEPTDANSEPSPPQLASQLTRLYQYNRRALLVKGHCNGHNMIMLIYGGCSFVFLK